MAPIQTYANRKNNKRRPNSRVLRYNPVASQKKHNTTFKKRCLPKLSNWMEKWFTDWWGAEIISWFFAALSLLAILITLKIHNGKPLPDWPFNITLNALISIFANIGEMAMLNPVAECLSQLKWLWFTRKRPLTEFEMFDNASRGPVGSFRLFIMCRGTHLASLGTAITLVALAFGPFAQQVITYPSKFTYAGFAWAPQVINFTGATDFSDGGIDQYLSAALYNGLSASNANFSTVLTTCETGNCTFPLYSSLGVRASVADVSKHLIEVPYNSPCVFGGCFNYTLPGIDDYNISFSGLDSAYDMLESDVIANSWGIRNFQANSSIGILGHPTFSGITPISFFLFYQPPAYNYADYSINWNASQPSANPPIALECKLEFCVHKFATTVNSGITKTILNSTELFEYDPSLSSNINMTVDGVNFYVNGDAVVYIWKTMANVFSGVCTSVVPIQGTHPIPYSDSSQGLQCASPGSSIPSPALPSFFRAINSTSDPVLAVQNIMRNLSITVTNSLRLGISGDMEVSQIMGKSYSTKTYVQAEYLWLTLPIGLVFLTLIFMIATISKSRNAKTEIWKSSSLAMLQGFHPSLYAQLGALHAMDEVETIAEGLQVRLEMGESKGWSLVRAN